MSGFSLVSTVINFTSLKKDRHQAALICSRHEILISIQLINYKQRGVDEVVIQYFLKLCTKLHELKKTAC